MSSQPEVAITIMTGGQHGAAETGPTPMPLDQLLSAGGGPDAGGAADAIRRRRLRRRRGRGPIDEPIPLDLDELAALAAPRRRSPAKKTTVEEGAGEARSPLISARRGARLRGPRGRR